jgi:pimeloyl-ACP methyl ester carboxylesterase
VRNVGKELAAGNRFQKASIPFWKAKMTNFARSAGSISTGRLAGALQQAGTLAAWFTARSSRGRATRLPVSRGGALVATGVALAAAALFVRYKTRQAERANPPIGNFIEVDGVRLHYVERGEGQPVVLLHGNGTMIEDFDLSGVLDLAATRYRVIAFDRPGYGHSTRPRGRVWSPKAQAEVLHEAMQRLGIERPIVVGHSWGAFVALALALQFPSDVRGLVLLSGYYFATVRLDAPLLAGPAIPVIGDLMRHTVSPLLGRLMWPALLRRMFSPADVPRRFDRFPLWMSLRPMQLRAAAGESALMIPAALALRRRYRELTMPIVIMAGDEDRYVDARQQSARLHRELPQSELRLAPGAGHMVHHVAPGEVLAAIDSAAMSAL